MTTNADVMNELANAAQAVTALTDEVSGKVIEINNSITGLNQLAESTAQEILSKYQDPLRVEYYVSMNGDDSNTGGSYGTALRTLSEAISRVKRGTALTVKIKDVDEPFILNETVSIKGIFLTIEMDGSTALEQGEINGVISTISTVEQGVLRIDGGKIKTSISNKQRGYDTAFIKRNNTSSSKAYIFSCNIELGNHDLFAGGTTATGLHELGLGHLDVKHRDDGNAEGILASITSGNLAFSWATGKNSTGKSLSELFQGVVRATDGEPKNILSNVSI